MNGLYRVRWNKSGYRALYIDIEKEKKRLYNL